MKQAFEVDWQGGKVSEQLIQSLLWEYLSKFGGVQTGVSVVEVAAQQLAEADIAGRLRAAREVAEIVRSDNAAFLAFDEGRGDPCAALHRAVIRTCDDFLAALGDVT